MSDQSSNPAMTQTTSWDSNRQRYAFWATLVVFMLGIAAIGIVAAADDDNGVGGLPKLSIGASGALGAMESRSAAGDAAMMAPAGYGVEYRVEGDLPDMPSTAAAFRLDAATAADAERIAAALGLDGAVKETADEFVVSNGGKELHVMKAYGSSWWFNDTAGQEKLAASTTTSSGSGSGCDCPPNAACDCPADTVMVEPAPCEMPPCPEGEACTQACPTPDYKEPERPADLPTQDEARDIATPILRALGAETGDLRVDDGFSAWYVNAPVKAGGTTVEGLMTSVGIGPKGAVLSANGIAGATTALGDYPLVTVDEGVERLKSGFPYSGDDCIDCARTLEAETTDSAETQADPDAPVSSDGGGTSGSSAGSSGSSGASAGPDDGADPDAARCAADGPDCEQVAPSEPMTCEPSEAEKEAALKAEEERRAAASGNSSSSAGATEPATAPAAEPATGCASPSPEPYPAPEPTVVTITGVHMSLLHFGGDTLVPAFVFETDDGGSIPVIAVEKEYLETVAPDQGGPEPAIEPMPAEDSGTSKPEE